MKLELVTAAADIKEPVTVAEMKDRSRIDTSAEDALIATMLRAALAAGEAYTWSRFVTQTWNAYYDSFADLKWLLPYPPHASITSVKYVDTNGATQTVADTVYELGYELGVGVVRLAYDQNWPTDVRSHSDVVIVQHVCGYGAASDVPQAIKSAIILHAANAYECRESPEVPQAFCNLLEPHSYRSFMAPFWGGS